MKMIQKIKLLFEKYREIIIYVIFGALTTAVDFGTYILLTRLFAVNEGVANVIAQIIAIVFAFFTNKLFVFNDRSMRLRDVCLQFAKFTSMRLVTLVLNSGLFFILNEVAKINDIVTKIGVSVIVIILNYIFSKLIVFKKVEK